MSRTRPTLKDIAKVANCSTAVVSTVINHAKGNTLVSDEMRKKVRQAADELGYRPNFASRSLVRQSTETIGLYIPPATWAGIGLPYEGVIVTGIEHACREHGYDLLAINLGGKRDHRDCHYKFAEGRIDGLVLLHLDHKCDWLNDLLDANHNVVAVNYYGNNERLKTINFDDQAAIGLAIQHLVDLGHTRIGWIGSRYMDLGPGAALRREGYRKAMADAGLEIDERWVYDFTPGTEMKQQSRQEDGADAIREFWQLDADQRPTAAACYSDGMAAGAMAELKRMGLALPEAFSVIGVDDSEICEFTSPQLTSIRQPLEAMGYRAATSVIEATEKRRSPKIVENGPDHLLSEPKLIVRESTAPPSP